MGQPLIPLTPEGTSVAGKTIVITGGNAGLGLEAARQFLVLGCSRMILACRSLTKGKEAAASLRANPAVKATNPAANIEVFELDLDDYQSGLRFTKQVNDSVPELDILLNNGGVALMRFEKSPTGHERTMQVNCYTHILISLSLLSLLQRTAIARGAPTRITFVGSGTQTGQATLTTTPIPEEVPILSYFDNPANFSRFRRYADSKLVVNAYTRWLATLAPGEVVVNNLCPGFVQTGLDNNLPGPLRVFMGWVRRRAARTVGEGARTLVYAAAVAGKETSGLFLQQNKVVAGAPFLNGPHGDRFVERLGKETVEDLAKIDPALARFA